MREMSAPLSPWNYPTVRYEIHAAAKQASVQSFGKRKWQCRESLGNPWALCFSWDGVSAVKIPPQTSALPRVSFMTARLPVPFVWQICAIVKGTNRAFSDSCRVKSGFFGLLLALISWISQWESLVWWLCIWLDIFLKYLLDTFSYGTATSAC